MIDSRLNETHILALTLYAQATIGRRERLPGALEDVIALGCVIRNRVQQQEGTYREVCETFSCWQPGEQQGRLQTILDELLTGQVTDPKYREAAWVATGIIQGYCRDVIQGATRSHPASQLPRPDWAQRVIPKLTYGRQTYYEGHV